jgi:hypothetical protein
MRLHRPAFLLAIALVCADVSGSATQSVLAPTDQEIEEFLRTARVVRTRSAGKGVTGSLRATLSDGTLTHDAQIQTIDERKSEFRGGKGPTEFNFRDDWRFNVAAYKIDRLLDLRLVPVSVQRTWNSTRGAFTWWLDDIQMDEGGRLKQKIAPPSPACWVDQVRMLRVFDQLIDNTDRNLGNLLIAKNWRVWAIDHTRAFRYSKTIRKPGELIGIDRQVLARLETLEFESLKASIGDYITDEDIRNLLARRDSLVAHFKTLGDVALYDRREPALGCSSGSPPQFEAVAPGLRFPSPSHRP